MALIKYDIKEYNYYVSYLQEEGFRLSEAIKGSDLGDLIKACQEPTAVC